MTNPSLDLLTDRFTYLDDLRESGVTNMYGAGTYLRQFMGCSLRESREVLGQWMATFGDGSLSAEDRAINANLSGAA